MTRLRQRMLDDLRRRNYSPDTIRGYIRAVQQFAEYFGRSPEQMGAEQLHRYQLYLLHERKLTLGTVENCISALRFLYKKTLKRRDLAFDDLPFPKQPRTLPTVLSQDEVILFDRFEQWAGHKIGAARDFAFDFSPIGRVVALAHQEHIEFLKALVVLPDGFF